MNCQYEQLDPIGISVGIISFTLAMLYSFHLLSRFDLNRKIILYTLSFSAFGHLVGAFALFEFAIRIGADSCYYFANAVTEYNGMGYQFAFMVLGYAKEYILGESFLGAFLISGSLGLIASTYLFVTYKILIDKISGGANYYLSDPKQLTYPAILLMCWPSYFFWSAGLIKDNFAFLSITMILFCIAKGKITLSTMLNFAVAAFLGFLVRPYLFIIFAISGFIYVLLNSNLKLQYKILILSVLAIGFMLISPVLNEYGNMVHFTGGASFTAIGEYAIRQQGLMAIGSSIPMPTRDPHAMFLFIPYLIFANLLLPLGIGAKNLIGAISSIENFYLFLWIVWFFSYRSLWLKLSKHLKVTKFLMIYFLFGMTCLSIMCTNLGLAMREKMMYVPALLLCMLLTYAYRRMLIIERRQREVSV